MGVGSFGDNGELYFEIQLVAFSGEAFSVDALFDTGFTDGWLAINTQDLEALELPLLTAQIEITTARGNARFDIHEGKVQIDRSYHTRPRWRQYSRYHHGFVMARYYGVVGQ
jgi:predicted aspartyl protease